MLAEHVECGVELIGAPVRRNVDTISQHEQTNSVTHFGEHNHTTLELGSPQVLDVANFSDLVDVVRKTCEPTLPGKAHLATGIPTWVSQRVDNVGLVRNVGLVQLLNKSKLTPASGHPLGGNDDVGTDVLAKL